MSESLRAALATEGLWLLVVGAILGGFVRGFAGFGTAMVFIPFAAQVFHPIWVLIVLITIDILGPIPALPRAVRDGQIRDVARLSFGAIVGIPLGLMVLTSIPQEAFRYLIAVVSLGLLVLLITGVRYRGPMSRTLTVGTGMIGGLFGGAVLLPGPPVIFLYMARPIPVQAIRANILLYLFITDLIALGVVFLRGFLEWQPILVGLLIMPIYLVSILIGTRIFDPSRETVYRYVAYVIIAGSALRGLPIWD